MGSGFLHRFLLFSKILTKIVSGFYYFQKNSACGGLLLFYFSPKTKFGIVFGQISRFCLKNTLKNFRLRRADRSGSYYFQKISACGGLLLFLFSQNFLALIIFLKSSRNFLLLLLFYFITVNFIVETNSLMINALIIRED